MTNTFTTTDHKILDFLMDNYLELLFQLEVDGGKATYFRSPIKLELTFAEPNTDNVIIGEMRNDN